MKSLRWLVFLFCLKQIQGRIEKGGVLGRKDIPTITVVSTYTALETTSVMLTNTFDSNESLPTRIESSEDTQESLENEDAFETESPEEKEKEAAWSNDKQIMDPPSQPFPTSSVISVTPTFRPLSASSLISVTPTFRPQANIPSGTQTRSALGSTTNFNSVSRPTVAQSLSQSFRPSSSSLKGATNPTTKPTTQSGQKNSGVTCHLSTHWTLLVVLIVTTFH